MHYSELPMRGTALELGCGHGLPGIVALSKGCSQVVFTDYNDDVSVLWMIS